MEGIPNKENIRITICSNGCMPVLFSFDRKTHNIESLIEEISNRLCLDKRYRYQLTMESGALIENPNLIYENDIIFIKVKQSNYQCIPNTYQINKPLRYPEYSNLFMPTPYNINHNMYNLNAHSYKNSFPDFPIYNESIQYGGMCGDIKADKASHINHHQLLKDDPLDQLLCQNPEELISNSSICKDYPNNTFKTLKLNTDHEITDSSIDNRFLSRNPFPKRSKSKDICHDDINTFTLYDIVSNQRCDLHELENRKFTDRDEMIELVRVVAKNNGFNICIPRGDIKLTDGTEQVTLYCDKYGNKRKRALDGKERYSKKTNCKWKVKFQKKIGMDYYIMTPSSFNQHNHHMNNNIKKRKSNKQQGKRSHVKYKEQQRLKNENKIKEEQDSIHSSNSNKYFKRFKDNFERENEIILKQKHCEPSSKQNEQANKINLFKNNKHLHKRSDNSEDLFDSENSTVNIYFNNNENQEFDYDSFSSDSESEKESIDKKSFSINSSTPFHFSNKMPI